MSTTLPGHRGGSVSWRFSLVFLLLCPLPLMAQPHHTAAGHRQQAPVRAAVAANDPLAIDVGMKILRAGGNAVDSAVATALALAVVYPEAGNLGGGGFAVVRLGDQLRALDFRETAPADATPTLYLDPAGNPRPLASLVGPLASGVPGSPSGLYELHRELGHLPWAQVVAPARELAENGFPVSEHLHHLLGLEASQRLLRNFPESMATWLPDGKPPATGTILRLPALAATLTRYAEKGSDAIMTGPVAEAVAASARQHGGILRASDLASYRPVWREPVLWNALGWQFASMPLPSAGGIELAQIFGMLNARGWSAMPPGSADRNQLLAETFRRVYADRFNLGDPSTTQVTAAQLLAPSWIAARAQSIDLSHATPSLQVHPWDKAAAVAEGTETTHLSVIDRDGNLVALTTTLNALFGCGLYVAEAGFFLNNEMDDFATALGKPNLFGLQQGEANAVGAGKRMLSSMVPTVGWRGDDRIAIGARGGSRIPTSIAQVLLNLLVDNDDLRAAVAKPRIHQQWMPDRIETETGALSPAVQAELERRGQTVFASPAAASVNVVLRRGREAAIAAVDARSERKN